MVYKRGEYFRFVSHHCTVHTLTDTIATGGAGKAKSLLHKITFTDYRYSNASGQLGKSLKPAEKLAALPGKPNQWLGLCASALPAHIWPAINLQQKGQAVRLGISQAVFIMQFLYTQPHTINIPHPSTDTLMEWISYSHTIVPEDGIHSALLPHVSVQMHVDEVLETFQTLAETEKLRKVAFRNPNTLPCTGKEDGAAGVKIGKLSPVEFVLILVLIARHPSASNAKLARHILGLRDRIHDEFVGEKKYNKKLF